MSVHKKERGIISSIFAMKCPRCREGDLFKTPTFSYKNPTEMYENCLACGQTYNPEPGFWFGAMFVSYVWTAWACLIFIGGGMWGLGLSINMAFLILILVVAVLYFWIFRISRSMWIHFYVKHDAEAIEKLKRKS